MILLNPGPVTLTARVRAALGAPDMCHRETEFAEMQERIRTQLRAVYGLDESWAAVLLSGSGTAAVEAMISSLPGANARLLVVANGVYGERMAAMARAHDIASDSLRMDWGEPVCPEALEAMLADGGFSHVAIVHHETTTGRLNDLEAIGAVCAAHDARLLVDAVSSFGAEAIDFQTLPIDACAATANKCLHGAPGVAFVIARRTVLQQATPRTLYLDLAAYCQKQDACGTPFTPFTPAIPAFYALAEALAEHAEEGGWQARRARYRVLARQAADGLVALHIEPLLPADSSSCVLRAYRLPQGVDYATLHAGLKNDGFVIYAGQGGLADTIFRISTMGDIVAADMTRLLASVAAITASA